MGYTFFPLEIQTAPPGFGSDVLRTIPSFPTHTATEKLCSRNLPLRRVLVHFQLLRHTQTPQTTLKTLFF